MRGIVQDVRFGFRQLKASPGFAAVAVITLALGIATAATTFIWIDSTLTHPFHGAAASDRLAVFETVTPEAPNGGTALSWPDYLSYREGLKQIDGMLIRRQCAFTLEEQNDAQLTWGEIVSTDYFDVLGVKAKVGRLFTGSDLDNAPGSNPVAVISERMWRQRFHGDPGLVGRVVRINQHPLTVVGIAPKGFHGTVPVLLLDVWIPVSMSGALGVLDATYYQDRSDRVFDAIVRLKPGVTVEQARAEAAAAGNRLAAQYPRTNRGRSATVLPPSEQHDGVHEYLSAPLRILMAVSLVMLVIVCANIANLLLARSLGRRREFGIRLAVGAARFRIVRQLLVETTLFVAAGAAVAYPLLLWMLGSIAALIPDIGLPLTSSPPLNMRIYLFALGICIVSALVSGIAPALFSMGVDVCGSLKDGGRTATSSPLAKRARALIVLFEMALTFVVLISAGLFVRSFENLKSIRTGFESDHVLFGRFFIESSSLPAERILSFAPRLRNRLESTAEIESVSYSDFAPLASTAGPWSTVRVDGYSPPQMETVTVNRSIVGPAYFRTLSIPLIAGREFDERDERGTERVMIVNQAFARRYFEGADPVGRVVRENGRPTTIVGYVPDTKQFNANEPPRPHFYLPFAQRYNGTPELYFFAKTRGRPLEAAPTLRRAVMDIEPSAAGFHSVPLGEYTQVANVGHKIAATLTGTIGLMSVFFAALGLYGVMAYNVRQRTSEFGIRMAMGAQPRDIVSMLLREGLRLAAGGLMVGVGIALAFTSVISDRLVGVGAFDVATFAKAALLLLFVALLATLIPAARAALKEPDATLRQ